jgi:hypothetical protein
MRPVSPLSSGVDKYIGGPSGEFDNLHTFSVTHSAGRFSKFFHNGDSIMFRCIPGHGAAAPLGQFPVKSLAEESEWTTFSVSFFMPWMWPFILILKWYCLLLMQILFYIF